MFMINVWSYLIIAVLVVPATLSRKLDLMESNNSSKRTMNPEQQAAPFLAGGILPAIPGIHLDLTDKLILQRLPNSMVPNTIYYVSVFDTYRNIPHYSAYRVTPDQATKIGSVNRDEVKSDWRNPVLDNKVILLKTAYDAAITADSELQRGHMNPSGINSFDKEYMKATFTLSNAAPIFRNIDADVWNGYESRIRDYAKCTCGNSAGRGGTLYLLTGTTENGFKEVKGEVVRDTSKVQTPITKTASLSLHTPSAIWTAGCCVWTEPGVIFRNVWPYQRAESFAVMCNNRKSTTGPPLTEINVAKLEQLLSKNPTNPSERVNLFPGKPGCRQPQNPTFTLPL